MATLVTIARYSIVIASPFLAGMMMYVFWIYHRLSSRQPGVPVYEFLRLITLLLFILYNGFAQGHGLEINAPGNWRLPVLVIAYLFGIAYCSVFLKDEGRTQ